MITVDNQPANVGHRLAEYSVKCSTLDQEAVLGEAQRFKIDGIFTIASDLAIPTVAYVTEKMGLQGPSRQVTGILTNKYRFRAFQKAEGLFYPRFAGGKTLKDIKNAFTNFKGTLLFKPCDLSGFRNSLKNIRELI